MEKKLVDDIVENDFDIDEMENTEETVEKKYEKAQRELVTQTVDFNIRTLANMVDAGQIDTNPKYQRRLRWDEARQSKLIESFFMNVPIPPLFFAEVNYGQYAVIDGQQRLRALHAFFSNMLSLQGLEVFKEINTHRFSELPSELQSILNMRPTIRCIIILRQSHPEIKFEVFERLNTGGVRLNSQEIRNSAFRGPLNDLILELSEMSTFRKLLKVKIPATSTIVQHMRDCELVLRFFCLKDEWQAFSGTLKTNLNRFMEKNQYASSEELEKLKSDFNNTIKIVTEVFGDKAFLRYDASTTKWGKQVLASVYDAQMIACYGISLKEAKSRRDEIMDKFKQLFKDDDNFVKSVISQTSNKSKIQYRINEVSKIVKGD